MENLENKEMIDDFLEQLEEGYDIETTPNFEEEQEENSESKEILMKLDALTLMFNEKIKVDQHKNTMFDNMHKELTQYKNGVNEKLLISVCMDIIQEIDSLYKMVEHYKVLQEQGEDNSKIIAIYEDIIVDLQDVLYRQGVEPYSCPSDKPDVNKQKIISIVKVNSDDESLHNTIAKRITLGYEKDGKVIRPERISIYQIERK